MNLGSLLRLRLRFFLNLRQGFDVHLPSSDHRTEPGTSQRRLCQLPDLRFVLRHTVINQLFDVLLNFQSEKKSRAVVHYWHTFRMWSKNSWQDELIRLSLPDSLMERSMIGWRISSLMRWLKRLRLFILRQIRKNLNAAVKYLINANQSMYPNETYQGADVYLGRKEGRRFEWKC